MIYLDKLTTKLNAILAKGAQDIVDRGIYIPFLGTSYTLDALMGWLGICETLLSYIKSHPNTNIDVAINAIYVSLGSEDQLIADAILSGENFDLGNASSREAYDQLRRILLYKFITTS